MDYYIAQTSDGKFYLRNDRGEVSQLFETADEAETAGFKRRIKWENVDD